MKHVFVLAFALLATVASVQARNSSAVSAPATPPPSLPMSESECQVWNREISFADSVARHDAAGFAEHLQAGAVFLDGLRHATRGHVDIEKSWADIIKGQGGVLHWHPDTVVIGGDPDVALSRGPWWIADTSPDAKQPYLMGSYISTWVRGDDGVWHVLFDGGGGNRPVPASAEDIAKLLASFPAVCPQP